MPYEMTKLGVKISTHFFGDEKRFKGCDTRRPYLTSVICEIRRINMVSDRREEQHFMHLKAIDEREFFWKVRGREKTAY